MVSFGQVAVAEARRVVKATTDNVLVSGERGAG